MILDCLVLDGNPADSTLVVEAIERQKSIFGRVPKEASFDGGFTSNANLKSLQALVLEAMLRIGPMHLA